MSSSDEDEKFLYGSDDEGAPATASDKKRNISKSEEPAVKRAKNNEAKTVGSSSSSDEESSDEENSEDESDVEFIIGVGTDSSKLDSKQAGASTSTAGSKPTTIAAPTLEVATALEETDALTANGSGEGLGDETVEDTPQAQPGTERHPVLDLNAPGKLGDQLVTDIDPEVLKEKPWRQPGANLSDYFNYGFNEQTWIEYLHKQEKLRAEYNPHKLLVGLLALQQQGKLNDSGSDGKGQDNGPPSMAPPGFPMGMPPMFGGFPFPFPGMMNNMNPQQKK
ncbi:LANO_0G06876g1_1 [Lachancea nothofagi CBS 11611]|uniref:Pre-mRNA polyadenylation factor FIP1 n=1 Tax=Lachancea nothofagi CBS 11611 TaxID=1266666 RepID=A0A1G4KH82_9SACH|nr:LANO_0G06876g1_1 [Lachancea nothofagi CBS 11611]